MAKQTQTARKSQKQPQLAGQQRNKPARNKQPFPVNYTAEQRQQMIAESAYYLAEQRNFQGDLALNDWLQAETAIDASLPQ